MKIFFKGTMTAIVLSLLGASVALAHTRLASSLPADEAQLSAAPQEITLQFSEAVRLTVVALQTPGGSEPLEPGSTDAATEFEVALPALAAGEYLVQWRAVSADTHVISGEIRFTITG